MAKHSHAGLAYTTVCREWRCKFKDWPATRDEAVTSRIVADCNAAYDSIKEELKANEGVVVVNRLMCSTCCDYKIMVTMDADVYGQWKERQHQPEEAFLEALRQIEGVCSAEAQLYSIQDV